MAGYAFVLRLGLRPRASSRAKVEANMHQFVPYLTLRGLLPLGGIAMGQGVSKLVDAVGAEKAAESVDTDKITDAVSTDGVDYEKAYNAPDADKAVASVDVDTVKEAMTSPK